MNNGRVRCFFFDLGQVLISVHQQTLAERMVALTGLDLRRLREIFLSDDLVIGFESGAMSGEEFYREICRRAGTEIEWRDFLDAWNSMFDRETIVPDETVRSLAAETDLWVISNTNPLHYEYIAGHYPILRHFKGFTLSYKVGVLKPDERIFLDALEQAGVRASESVFVDDRVENVEGARKIGIDSFQFTGRESFLSELRARGLPAAPLEAG